MKNTVIEIRARIEDPKKVEFYADGKLLTNITAERVFNLSGKLTAEAVIVYDKKNKGKPSAEVTSEDTLSNGDNAS